MANQQCSVVVERMRDFSNRGNVVLKNRNVAMRFMEMKRRSALVEKIANIEAGNPHMFVSKCHEVLKIIAKTATAVLELKLPTTIPDTGYLVTEKKEFETDISAHDAMSVVTIQQDRYFVLYWTYIMDNAWYTNEELDVQLKKLKTLMNLIYGRKIFNDAFIPEVISDDDSTINGLSVIIDGDVYSYSLSCNSNIELFMLVTAYANMINKPERHSFSDHCLCMVCQTSNLPNNPFDIESCLATLEKADKAADAADEADAVEADAVEAADADAPCSAKYVFVDSGYVDRIVNRLKTRKVLKGAKAILVRDYTKTLINMGADVELTRHIENKQHVSGVLFEMEVSFEKVEHTKLNSKFRKAFEKMDFCCIYDSEKTELDTSLNGRGILMITLYSESG